MPKKPKVKLIREDGNAFSIIGRVSRALKSAGYPKEHIDNFCKEAMSGDYDKVLQTVMKYVDVY
jgi:hypothetical protein